MTRRPLNPGQREELAKAHETVKNTAPGTQAHEEARHIIHKYTGLQPKD